MGEPIDLYNKFCDEVRPRMGSYVDIAGMTGTSTQGATSKKSEAPGRIAGGTVVMATPLCSKHDFVSVDPVRGFKGEILAQMKVCLTCGHAEREKV